MSQIRVIVRRVKSDYIIANYESLLGILYPARQEQVKKFKNKQAACVSISAGRLLQDVAFEKLGITPNRLIVKKGEQGKPYIEGYENFHFNLSHSGDYVVMAYGDKPVGIDIEQVRDKSIKVAERCFTESELQYIKYGYVDNERFESVDETERFYQIWTMKESYLKLIGKGISIPLNSFSVNVHRMMVDGTDCHFYMKAMTDYFITVCAKDVSGVTYIPEEEESPHQHKSREIW